MTTPFKRVHLIVMDSVGIGEAPDAAAFNDEGSHTLKHTLEGFNQTLPNLEKLDWVILKNYLWSIKLNNQVLSILNLVKLPWVKIP